MNKPNVWSFESVFGAVSVLAGFIFVNFGEGGD